MSLFLTKNWVETISNTNRSLRTQEVNSATGRVYLAEYKKALFKKWILYQELENVEEIFDLAKKAGAMSVECAFNMSRWSDEAALKRAGAKITMEFGTYVVDLSEDEEVLWGRVHSKHRNVVRRAMKEDVEIRFHIPQEELFHVITDAYSRSGQTHQWSLAYLQTLLENMSGNLLTAGAYQNGRLQAAAVIPYDNEVGYYLHGGSAAGSVLGSGNLLHWEIIKKLKSMGLAVYDFGGARRETDDERLRGIFRFKERFGGRFVPCYYWVKVLKPIRYALFNFVKKIV